MDFKVHPFDLDYEEITLHKVILSVTNASRIQHTRKKKVPEISLRIKLSPLLKYISAFPF
jgi:hypothetical protein